MTDSRTVVIYLESTPQVAELRHLLEVAGFDALMSDSSDQIRRLGNQRRIDCLIIEQELTGFLTGIEIVERIRRELLNPVVVLIGDVPPEQYALMRELKVDHVLSHSMAPQVIVECVRASLLTSGPRSLRIPLAARQIAEASDCFKPLPQLVLKVMGRLGEDGGDTGELAADLSTDPRLTAELLRITNSSASGLRFKVNHLGDAIKYLGYRRTVALVVAITQKSLHGDGLRKLPGWVEPWFRTRLVLTASVAHVFAAEFLPGTAETAYVVGLLQDLGILSLAHHLGPRYLQLVERCRSIGQLQLLIGEHQQFNVDHAEVSAALLQKWGVPVSIIALVLNHHDDKPRELTEFEIQMTEIVRFAESVADMHDAPSPQRQRRLIQQAEAFRGLRSDSCKSCLARAVAKTAEFETLLQIPVPPEEELQKFIDSLNADPPAADPESIDGYGPEIVRGAHLREEAVGRRLLVVEDDEEMIELITALLEGHGVEVVPVKSAERAIRIVEEFLGVLCDIHLPGMSGIEFVADARRRGYSGSIVMITGDSTRDSVMRSAQSGATGYLLKPFTRSELVSTLRRHRVLP
ncbi:HDOD domain-containing protein [Planctellipticum variicoloris]|uniref:HDOD domain-containing protein n=1 Tax=Planctellipticum variicoloris TaxID=3064265 RepID=UPI003013E8DD|nr:HDOD domain-containing protein [Planctomycetaceae bacterium SH412]